MVNLKASEYVNGSCLPVSSLSRTFFPQQKSNKVDHCRELRCICNWSLAIRSWISRKPSSLAAPSEKELGVFKPQQYCFSASCSHLSLPFEYASSCFYNPCIPAVEELGAIIINCSMPKRLCWRDSMSSKKSDTTSGTSLKVPRQLVWTNNVIHCVPNQANKPRESPTNVQVLAAKVKWRNNKSNRVGNVKRIIMR